MGFPSPFHGGPWKEGGRGHLFVHRDRDGTGTKGGKGPARGEEYTYIRIPINYLIALPSEVVSSRVTGEGTRREKLFEKSKQRTLHSLPSSS